MKKHVKFTASIGLASIAVYALAQVQVVNRGGNQGTLEGRFGASQARGIGFAAKTGLTPQSPVILAMRWHIAGQIDKQRIEAKVGGRTAVAEKLMEVSCWAVLTGMTPKQQRHEIESVWQLARYKPSGDWNHVAAAPSMVSELLKVSDSVNAKIEAITQAGRERDMAPYRQFAAALREQVKRTGEDYSRVHDQELKKFYSKRASAIAAEQGRPTNFSSYEEALAVVANERAKDKAADLAKIKALLSAPQLAEWSRIERSCLAKAAVASRGGDPFQPVAVEIDSKSGN